jgi:predicted AAA+ superfamily ATPase
LPFSFKEYKEANQKNKQTKNDLFNDYLKYGSFPYVATLDDKSLTLRPYLEGIYSTILVKDVAVRESINDITLLEQITKILASSIGSPISIKKIADTINSSGRKISVNTVEKYVRALTESYIFYKVDRYDIKGKQYLKTLGKYYIVDVGIRQMLVANASTDLGHIIENIVFLELKRRGYKVHIGKLAQKEVDFVASFGNEIIYYQVAATVLNEATLRRELEPLENIADHYTKVLLTLDEVGSGSNHRGIKQLNLIDWLIKK